MASTRFKQDEIVVLLGAGASVDASVPHATDMVRHIDHLVTDGEDEWTQFRGLYHYIRSAIYYADGVDGAFGDAVLFNIERLVNTLDEIRKKERHPLYPFVGAWNPKLLEVAGEGFGNVRKFRSAIIDRLRREWVELERTEEAEYYRGLLDFQEEYEFPLRVFSLNYDLCVEKACGLSNVQRGFENRVWDWRLFDESSDDPKAILLYKLHGSTDWRMTTDGQVEYVDSPLMIDEDDLALIFGVSYKLQYIDPFLFLAYELRRWTLADARMILAIGYGFGDEHINGILQQSLRQEPERKLVAVIGPCEQGERQRWQDRIRTVLSATHEQVVAVAEPAQEFLTETLSIDFLAQHFPEEEDLIPEVGVEDGMEE